MLVCYSGEEGAYDVVVESVQSYAPPWPRVWVRYERQSQFELVDPEDVTSFHGHCGR